MRLIRGVALGTYYAAGANAAKATANASSMRGLVYAVKDNRDPPNPKQFVAHPLHPSPRPVAVDRTNAIEYITAGVGLGTVAVLAVQREMVIAKTKGSRRTADQTLDGFVRTSISIPRSNVVVLVDDNVHSGNSLAALDRLLGASRPTSAFAVAVTDSHECKNAVKARGFTIEYDETAKVLDVTCKLGAVR